MVNFGKDWGSSNLKIFSCFYSFKRFEYPLQSKEQRYLYSNLEMICCIANLVLNDSAVNQKLNKGDSILKNSIEFTFL